MWSHVAEMKCSLNEDIQIITFSALLLFSTTSCDIINAMAWDLIYSHINSTGFEPSS